ncbi:hypothetical protein U1737_09155 [Sphingomonas sp. LB3N6]
MSADADQTALNKYLAECSVKDRARYFLLLSQWAGGNAGAGDPKVPGRHDETEEPTTLSRDR